MGFVQGTGDELSGVGLSLAVAFTSDVTAGNLIVVSFAEYSTAPTLSNISDSRGNVWTLNAQQTDGTGHVTVFTCTAKDSGPMTVTVTYGSTQYMAMAIAEFSGYTQTEVDEAKASSASGTNVHAGSVDGAGLYIGTHTNTQSDTTITPDANWDGTVYNNNGGTNYPSMVLGYREVGSGSYDDGWTLVASRRWGAIGLIFEAGSSVVSTGTPTLIKNSATTNQSQAVTVPTDANICLVLVTGLSSVAKTVILGELSMTGADRTDFTRIGSSSAYSAPYTYYQSEAWYLMNPPTGSQTLYWQVKDGVLGEGLCIAVMYFKNVHASDPIRDSEIVTTSYTTWTSALSGVEAPDMSVVVMYDYDHTPDADPSGYGQTMVFEDLYNHAGIGVAYEIGEDALYMTGLTFGLPVAVCLRAADTGGLRAKTAGGLTIMLKQFGT